jgi:carbon catabolite-derepressing protein kinase
MVSLNQAYTKCILAILAREPAMEPFLAQSPPSTTGHPKAAPLTPLRAPTRPPSQPIAAPPGSALISERSQRGSSSSQQTLSEVRSPATTIAILPSSLPGFHQAYMKGHPHPVADPNAPPHDDTPTTNHSSEEKAARARRLKPHSRGSQLHLEKAGKPEGLTPLPTAKKPRPIKWQFGIRSRNQPAEAMLAIYKALRAMGAEWEIPKIRKPGRHRSGSGSRSRSRSRSSSGSRGSDRGQWSDEEGDVDKNHHGPKSMPIRGRGGSGGIEMGRGRKRDVLGEHNDWGYAVPEDPWVIHARFRKEGMYPPGVAHPTSTQSSRVDLTIAGAEDEAAHKAHADNAAFSGPATGTPSSSKPNSRENSTTALSSMDEARGLTKRYGQPEECVYVYVTIQLYDIQEGFFLVDFKCAGYESLEKRFVREIRFAAPDSTVQTSEGTTSTEKQEWRQWKDGEPLPKDEDSIRETIEYLPLGRATADKRATSPFPFLDVASGLIIQLAEGGD